MVDRERFDSAARIELDGLVQYTFPHTKNDSQWIPYSVPRSFSCRRISGTARQSQSASCYGLD